MSELTKISKQIVRHELELINAIKIHLCCTTEQAIAIYQIRRGDLSLE